MDQSITLVPIYINKININHQVRAFTSGITSKGLPVGGNTTGINTPKIVKIAITAGNANKEAPNINNNLPFIFLSKLITKKHCLSNI